jgi:hypothetical protein
MACSEESLLIVAYGLRPAALRRFPRSLSRGTAATQFLSGPKPFSVNTVHTVGRHRAKRTLS